MNTKSLEKLKEAASPKKIEAIFAKEGPTLSLEQVDEIYQSLQSKNVRALSLKELQSVAGWVGNIRIDSGSIRRYDRRTR